MKIAIINDTHFGYKNSSQHFMEYQETFLKKKLFPYCEKHGIKNILHLGDLFDNRKHVTIKALNFVRTAFLEEVRERGMRMDIIPGNHDTSYKNTNDLCTLVEVLRHYKDCINVYMEPTIISFDDFPIGVVPWINGDNYNQCMNFIETAKCSMIVGHLELSGFRYIANSKIKSIGENTSIFSRYDAVLSGHYHTKSSKDNVTYLGSQYQFNWGDVDDKKYFHTFDTETRELTSTENTDKIYHRFYYNDENAQTLDDIIKKSVHARKNIYDKYVRVIVQKKTDFHLFDMFINHIKKYDPFDLQIIENFDIVENITEEDESAIIEDTSTLMDNYVDNVLDTDLNKEKIKRLLQQLYTEASMIESVR
jgi:DNA repair exonuclease SbcCD nuclease subunit